MYHFFQKKNYKTKDKFCEYYWNSIFFFRFFVLIWLGQRGRKFFVTETPIRYLKMRCCCSIQKFLHFGILANSHENLAIRLGVSQIWVTHCLHSKLTNSWRLERWTSYGILELEPNLTDPLNNFFSCQSNMWARSLPRWSMPYRA